MSAHLSSRAGATERLIGRCEDIPPTPAPGDYVVVDAMHFSNTVIELLAAGATHVHITDERGEEFAYREENPDAVIGGGSTPDYRPTEGYDFFNSPHYVQSLDVADRPVSMTSSNGGRAVATLRARAGDDPAVDVFVGSPMNAAALGAHLRERGRPVHVVAAGSSGEVAVEDLLGGELVARYVDGDVPDPRELASYRDRLAAARGPAYVRRNELRRRDVLDYAADLNGRGVVPRLDGEGLVDVGADTEGGGPADAGAT